MSITNRRRALILAALAIPLLALLPWILINQGYPRMDGADYLDGAYRIYRMLVVDGWNSFLTYLYFFRQHKTSMLPSAGAIMLFFTDGNSLWAIRFLNLIFFGPFVLFTYLSLEIFLPAAEAALGAALIGTLPWASFSAHYLGLEMPILALNVMGAYWLFQARDLKRTREAVFFGLSMGFSLCFRPADALLFFFIPLLLWIGRNLRERRLRGSDLLIWILAMGPFFFYFFRFQESPWVARLLILAGPPLLVLALRKKLKLNSPFAFAIFLAYLLPALWYGPFYRDVWDWIFESTYGDHAHRVSAVAGGFHFFGRVLWWLCGIPAFFVAIAALSRGCGATLKKEARQSLVVVLGIILFPIVVGATTHDLSVRYYFSSAWLLFVGGLTLALSPEEKLKRVRRAMVFVAMIFCFAWDFHTLFVRVPMVPQVSQDPQQEFFGTLTPVARDPFEFVLDALATRVDAGHHVFYPSYVQSSEAMTYLMGGGLLSSMAWERGFDWEFNRVQGAEPDIIYSSVDRAKLDEMRPSVFAHSPGWKEAAAIPFSRPDFDGVFLLLRHEGSL